MLDHSAVGLALARANFDDHAGAHSDSFLSIAVAALTNLSAAGSPVSVRSQIASRWGLDLPTQVVENLLRRAARRGLCDRKDRQFEATQEGIELALKVEERAREAARSEATVARELAATLRTTGDNSDIDEATAMRMLLGFLDRHAAPMLKFAVGLKGDAPEFGGFDADDARVASFVRRALVEDAVLGPALEPLIKGAVLTSALYLPAAGTEMRRFDRTTLYLDTPLLLKVSGMEGPEAEIAVRELVDAAKTFGARVCAFEHSFGEARGVLHGVLDVLSTGRSPSTVRGVLSHQLAAGTSPSEFLLAIEGFEGALEQAGLEILEKPPAEADLTLAEGELEESLLESISYAHPQAVFKDLDSIAAVYRLRRGRRVEQIERCRALLITDNFSLVLVANRFLGLGRDGTIGVAMVDHELSTVLWSKQPTSAPDLPINQVIADAYSLMDPGPRVWKRFMAVVDELAERNEVDAEQVFQLRFNAEVRSQVARLAESELDSNPGGVVERLLRVDDASQAAMQNRIDEAVAKAEESGRLAARHEIAAERARLRSGVATLSQGRARIVRRAIEFGSISLGVLLVLLSLLAGEGLAPLGVVAGFVVGAAGVVSTVTGTPLRQYLLTLEGWVAAKVRRRHLGILGLGEPGDAP